MTREFRLFKCEMLDRSDNVTLFSLCVRSLKKDEVFLYSIAPLILKHEGKPSDVLMKLLKFLRLSPCRKVIYL